MQPCSHTCARSWMHQYDQIIRAHRLCCISFHRLLPLFAFCQHSLQSIGSSQFSPEKRGCQRQMLTNARIRCAADIRGRGRIEAVLFASLANLYALWQERMLLKAVLDTIKAKQSSNRVWLREVDYTWDLVPFAQIHFAQLGDSQSMENPTSSTLVSPTPSNNLLRDMSFHGGATSTLTPIFNLPPYVHTIRIPHVLITTCISFKVLPPCWTIIPCLPHVWSASCPLVMMHLSLATNKVYSGYGCCNSCVGARWRWRGRWWGFCWGRIGLRIWQLGWLFTSMDIMGWEWKMLFWGWGGSKWGRRRGTITGWWERGVWAINVCCST